jgi:putative transposase
MQQNSESLRHTVWECKYHVVFIPKCRRKTLYGQIRRELGSVLRELAQQKECKIEEGHLMMDHVHMLISVPPKYSVALVMGVKAG